MITTELDQSIGVTAGRSSTTKCNYIAFADDLVLMSTTDIGMKRLMEQLESAVRSTGLRINPNKCATLRTETHRKEKRWIVNPTPYIKLHQSEDNGAIDVSQSYKYLGIQVGVRKQPASIGDKIKKSLQSISRTNKTLSTSLYSKSSFVAMFRSQTYLWRDITRFSEFRRNRH